MGGLFSIFHIKLASKAPKTCDFAYFTSQWGGGLEPLPPFPGYATGRKLKFGKVSLQICLDFLRENRALLDSFHVVFFAELSIVVAFYTEIYHL